MVEQNKHNSNIDKIFVDDSELSKLEIRSPLNSYIQQLWDRRHYIWLDAKSRVFASQRDLRLGRAWIIVQPLLDAMLYGVLFGLILRTSRGIDNFVGFLIIGISFFAILTKQMNQGIGLIRASRGMISSFYFPRASVVFSAGIRNVIDSIPSAIMAIVIALIFQFGKPVSLVILLVPAVFVMMHFFGIGLMFITARLTAQFPDFRVLIGLFARAWFYFSGIFFDVTRYANNSKLSFVMEHNPAYMFLTSVRSLVLKGELPMMNVWFSMGTWSILTFLIGFWYFWRIEEKYATAATL